MNSPRGFARTPAHIDRDGSISPLPLDSARETYRFFSPNSSFTNSDGALKAVERVPASAFHRLTSKLILRILWSVDANGFASLCILNRRWWREAQKVELYAHHLSRCPSYALSNNIISGPFRRNDLLRIKSKFAAEVRRNLFDAYVRPRRTFINLVSLNANSSAAFPSGEAFRFEFSPNATTALALSSSRIYVLDVTANPPVVKRQLKTSRRPLSASVTDDGSLLAVLSNQHQVNVYGLTPQGVQHLQVIAVDNSPKIIAIAPEGTVLAASYETGIEVFSLAANSLTTDKRAVRSEAVDTLNFSGDGSMLVGSSLGMEEPNAVVISAPFYNENDPDLSAREVHSRMWTTQILFPQISSVCSHVVLLPGHIEGDACWLFAFDHSLMSYRAVRTDDTRAGVAYFLSPPGADRFDTPIPSIPPCASACGTLAVAAFEGAGLWLYGIPERLDISPDMGAVIERQNERQLRNGFPLTSATGNPDPLLAYSPSHTASDYSIDDDSLASKVDWRQSLFVKPKSIHGLPGQTAARWVEDSNSANAQSRKRLVVVAPGGVSLEDDGLVSDVMPVDGSRMCLLDFDYTPSTSSHRIITIEVGEDEPELLTEHTGSLATEVAMERRRTIRAIPVVEGFVGPRMPLGRSVTSISPPAAPLFEDGYRRGSVSSPSSPIEYSASQSSLGGLHRSATASGFRYARYPPRPPLGSTQFLDRHHPAYQSTDQFGRPISEDSWETPPPPYAGANNQTHPHNHFRSGVSPVRQSSPPQPWRASRAGFAQQATDQARSRQTANIEHMRALPDAVMTSNALPAGGTIDHHEELMRAALSRGASEGSLDNVTEITRNSVSSPEFGPGHRSPPISPSGTNAEHHVRPVTHHGVLPQGWHAMTRSMSTPISPLSSSIPSMHNEQRSSSPVLPASSKRVSLTGANLQNRLNHPVPPIPENQQIFATPTTMYQQQYGLENQRTLQQPDRVNVYPSLPTFSHMANLNQPVTQSELQRPPGIRNSNFVHRGSPTSAQPSPPRAAWVATGVPTSPTFNQVQNLPNGFSHSRSNSQEHQMPNFAASASVPNLLNQRPYVSRLDTIDSIRDHVGLSNGGIPARSRAHSLTPAVTTPNTEPSAYHETSRAGPGLIATKHGKKTKRKKEETTKKGTKCVVM